MSETNEAADRPGTKLALGAMDVPGAAAGSLRSMPSVARYAKAIVNRVPGESDTIWITELWASQEELDGALDLVPRPQPGWERVELGAVRSPVR